MRKLLSKSYKAFIVYAAIVLACSIPVYYLIVDLIWEYELREHNHIVSSGIKYHLKSLHLTDDSLQQSINLWNRLQPDKLIKSVATVGKDSIYNVYRTKEFVPDKDLGRFQGLVSYFEWNGKPYSITVETNMEESYETIIALAVVTILFFLLLLGGLVAINRKLTLRLWKPFYHALSSIKAFDLNHHQSVSFIETDIHEFHELNTGLDKLIASNVAAYRQQKYFIENASHELQTPIAVVQSKLDIFLQEASLTDQQSSMVEQAQKALTRVNHINKNLLLLAKIENGQFPQKEEVKVDEIVQNSVEPLDSFIQQRHLNLAINLKAEPKVSANKILMEILLSNLLTNAIRYSPLHGNIILNLESNRLSISNTGSASLLQENLFKRFGRVSEEAPATGLGLSIVYEICKQFEWFISYEFQKGHHCFTIEFPD